MNKVTPMLVHGSLSPTCQWPAPALPGVHHCFHESTPSPTNTNYQ